MQNTVWNPLLEYARWSPSPHNIQPWKVKIISDQEAELYYDPKRLIPDTDITSAFTMVGLGIFLEYLRIAASHSGYSLQVEADWKPLDRTATAYTFVAKMKLEKGGSPDILSPESILKRRTSRMPYKEQVVQESVQAELIAEALHYGHTLTLSSDKEIVEWVLGLNRDTMFYDLNDEKTRKEIGLWLRYTKKQASLRRDGLWASCMYLPGILLYMFFHFRWFFNLPLIHSLAQKYYMRTMKGTRTVAWISGPFASPREWVQAGKMLGRLWLLMTKHGIYLHPFGSVITNEKAHARMLERIQSQEETSILWSLVRLGQSEEPVRSQRLSLEDILI